MLSKKIVAISGGAGLLGAGFSRAIVNSGGKVIVGDLSVDRGQELINELGRNNSMFIDVNTSNPDSIENFISLGMSHYGKIDCAIHCAYPRSNQWGTKFEDIESDGLKDDLYNQLGGAILFSQKFISYFRKQGYGNLIHISSIQGVTSPKFQHYEGTSMVSPIEYSAIKSGIISITQYLAKYCKGENIRVNCISPGGILNNPQSVFKERYNSACSSKGLLDASDLNGTIVYLLSEMSQFTNGQNIIVDDGWSL
jgi:NAD(P)-dependent dehydrogenase (short-subunit alcohol dehydrogenase family)